MPNILVNKYWYSLDATPTSSINATLHLFDGDTHRGMIQFIPDGKPLMTPIIDAQSAVCCNMPISRLPAVVDMLRNEAPVYLGLSATTPLAVWLYSALEPVGAGDENPPPGKDYMPP